MFSPIGAISSFGTGYQHGMTDDLPKMWNQLGMAALGRALQPIEGIDQGPQAPPPGQGSVPMQHPLAQAGAPRGMPPEMQGNPMAQQQTPMSGGGMPPSQGPSFNDRYSPVSAAVGSGQFDPQGANNSPVFSGGPPPMPQGGPPGAMPSGPGMGGPPGMASPMQGMPQFDLRTLIQRVHAANPNLPPQAMLAALTNAVPLLTVQGRHDLQMLALQQKYDTLDTRERIARNHEAEMNARWGERNDTSVANTNTRVEGANTRAELSRNTRLDIANLSAETRREIEEARTGRAQLSADAKREIAGMNIDARREITDTLEMGRTTRQGNAIASRESEGALNRGSREGIATGNQNSRENIAADNRTSREGIAAANEGGRMQRAEMSNSTKLELGKLSDSTKREIAAQAQQGRLDVATLSANARQELAGINNQARVELQTYIESERGARTTATNTSREGIAAAGNVSREAQAGLRADTTAEQGSLNRASREGIAGLNEEGRNTRQGANISSRESEGALNRGSREGIAATNEAGRQGRFVTREGRLDDQFNRTYDRLVTNAQQRWDMGEKKLQQALQLADTREGRQQAIVQLRTLEQEALANHRAISAKIQAGFLPNAKDKNALIAEANAKRDAILGKIEQYRMQLREGGQAPGGAAPAAPAGSAQSAAPAASDKIVYDPQGRPHKWDGKAWAPVQ